MRGWWLIIFATGLSTSSFAKSSARGKSAERLYEQYFFTGVEDEVSDNEKYESRNKPVKAVDSKITKAKRKIATPAARPTQLDRHPASLDESQLPAAKRTKSKGHKSK